jgi:hypothetical protein
MDQHSFIKLIGQLARPTESQIDNFIQRLTYHHSWYKHLSKDRIHDFVIYLDPNAGRTFQTVRRKLPDYKDYILKDEFYCDYIPMDKDKEGLDYQNSYSYWTYFMPEGTPSRFNPVIENQGRVNSRPYLALNIVDPSGLITPIPGEIIEKGTIRLSRYLHECFSPERANGMDYDGVTSTVYIQEHEEIIKDIKSLMRSMIDMIYGK